VFTDTTLSWNPHPFMRRKTDVPSVLSGEDSGLPVTLGSSPSGRGGETEQAVKLRPSGRAHDDSPQAGHVTAGAFRTALVNRLRAAGGRTVVTVVAPLGYGKTTLLAQWASRDARTFVWVQPGPGALGERVTAALAEAGLAGWPSAPSVLVFDDVHLLTAEDAELVSRLVGVTPPGSTVVLAGQSVPALPHLSLPRLRAGGRLLELGARDLAMTRREAARTLKALGAPLTGEQVTALLDATEGWAAGIRQAVSSLQATGRAELNGETSAFFREVCEALTDEQRSFLRRTSVLTRMSGALCDAALETSGSAQQLEELERLHVFVVPLDHRGEWFRYHGLLRAELRRVLDEQEPRLVPALHRRASDWLEENGDPGAAMEHAHAAGDDRRFLRIFGAAALAAHNAGNDAEIESCLVRMDGEIALRSDARAAVLAAQLHLHRGRLPEAQRCAAAASRSLSSAPRKAVVAARLALVRAAMCADGVDEMLADAERGLERIPADDHWRPYGLLLQGTACRLADESERADAILGRAVHAAERLGAHESLALALVERAACATERGDHDAAAAQLARALEVVGANGLDRYPTTTAVLAASARALLRQGRWSEAQILAASAHALLPRLTAALPWLAVQARLELATTHVMLRDAVTAAELVGEADVLLAPADLGRLRRERDLLAVEVRAIPPAREGQTPRLTGAELRLLPLLGTHLSFREIGARLFLSRHTVKTQAISAYRKLGASSRRDAVLNAARLGLIERPDARAA
jgi:LuxR family transcriptional regulator, maltose regulon positive regulatory protein